MSVVNPSGLKDILTQFIAEVWNAGEVDACDKYIAPNYTIHHDPGDPRFLTTDCMIQRRDSNLLIRVARFSATPPCLMFPLRSQVPDAIVGQAQRSHFAACTEYETNETLRPCEGVLVYGLE